MIQVDTLLFAYDKPIAFSNVSFTFVYSLL